MNFKICLLFVSFLAISTSAFGQFNPDVPNPDETFSSFFARITRGGGFPGIYLDAPINIQTPFLKTIQKKYWVGESNLVQKELIRENVDIWNDWYKQEKSFLVIFNSETKRAAVLAALTNQITKDSSQCALNCPDPDILLKTKWKNLDSFSRQEFVKTLIFEQTIFGSKSLIQYLGDVYDFPVSEIRSTTDIQVLANQDFISAVREAGYAGEIYFRGLTTVDPKNPQRHLVLLNEEMIYSGSPFTSEILKNLELLGILMHELSHVFQDLKGNSMGLDVQVKSAEAALLIEGSAEFLAEKAMRLAAAAEAPPSALQLFVAEQAVEIVYREGNESTGQLFPYTVGLPFSAALYMDAGTEKQNEMTKKILQFLSGNGKLSDWLHSF